MDERRPPAPGAAVEAGFSYDEAFSRNLGWLTEWEQQALRFKRVAIAGAGGVGGVHLLTLARFGVGAFHIADPDIFELANFNRQVGAMLSTIGRPKVEVMAERARDINPELGMTCFPLGVDDANLEQFLSGVDLLVDALDFFVLDIRRKLTDRCLALGIPVVNAAPIGMGTAYLVFQPGGMSFEEWFRLDGLSQEHQYVNYLLGMAPAGLHRPYLADPSRVDLRGRRGPSTPAACELCAGVASVEAVKLLLNRGDVKAVPYYHQFDAYRGRWVVRKLRGGNRNPVQRLKIAVARRLVRKLSNQAAAPVQDSRPATEIEKILDIARWAPSGDNTQPWRFEILDDERVVVHVASSSDIYDYNDGEPTLLSAGFLLETLRIASSAHGRSLAWTYLGRDERGYRITVSMPRSGLILPDPLLSYVPLRSVNRWPYRLTHLTDAQKSELSSALGDALTIRWHESVTERWRAALVGARASDIRLRIPETFDVHSRIIDWGRNFSPTGIPGAAIGLDPVARRLTRWLMGDWRRMKLANRVAGTTLARFEMDLLPGLYCAAHFTVSSKQAAGAILGPQAFLAAGQALQRFWLTATRLGLAMQPNLAPLCFAHYGRTDAAFTTDLAVRGKAASLAAQLDRNRDGANGRIVFRGRIGMPARRQMTSRSTRVAWRDLLA